LGDVAICAHGKSLQSALHFFAHIAVPQAATLIAPRMFHARQWSDPDSQRVRHFGDDAMSTAIPGAGAFGLGRL
jgi:hypothetical protein